MKVIKIAQVPSPTVTVDATVLEAVWSMQNARTGATAVLEDDQLVGIFSERDVMLRVVAAQRDAAATQVRQVMTSPVKSVREDHDAGDALELMVSNHVRHLPILDSQGSLTGLISIRNLLQHHVEELADQLNSLESYFLADGPGG